MIAIVFLVLIFFAIGAVGLYLLKINSGARRIENLVSLLKAGRFNEAIKKSQDMLKNNPKDCEARFILAKGYLALKKAEKGFKELQEINNNGIFRGICNEMDFRLLISDLYEQRGLYEDAQKELLLILGKNPNDYYLNYKVGTLFEFRKDYKNAIKYYKKSLNIRNDFADSHKKLGIIYYRAKKYPDALSHLQIAVMKGNNNDLYYNIGKIHIENKSYEEAIGALRKAQSENSVKHDATIELGIVSILTGEPKMAVQYLNSIAGLPVGIVKSEKNIKARYYLAKAYEAMGELERAVDQWEIISHRSPGFMDVDDKLKEHSSLRTSENYKKYQTASKKDFMDVCALIMSRLEYTVDEIRENSSGCIAIGSDSGNQNESLYVFFHRTPEPITLNRIRSLYDEMKSMGIQRTVVFTSASIKDDALGFANKHPIDFRKRDELKEVLY